MGDRPDLYQILGVEPTAEQAAIEAAFHGRLLRFRVGRFGERSGRLAGPSQAEIERAFAVLGDPAARARYDAEHFPEKAAPTPAPARRRFPPWLWGLLALWVLGLGVIGVVAVRGRDSFAPTPDTAIQVVGATSVARATPTIAATPPTATASIPVTLAAQTAAPVTAAAVPSPSPTTPLPPPTTLALAPTPAPTSPPQPDPTATAPPATATPPPLPTATPAPSPTASLPTATSATAAPTPPRPPTATPLALAKPTPDEPTPTPQPLPRSPAPPPPTATPVPPPPPLPPPAFEATDWIGTALPVNLRAGPGTDYPSQGVLRTGTLLEATGEASMTGGVLWRRFALPDGRLGWVRDLDTFPVER